MEQANSVEIDIRLQHALSLLSSGFQHPCLL